MTPRRWLLILVPALLAAKAEDVDDLIRKGNAAFHAGDLAAAVDHYEKAQARSTEPGLVAFNLATASYHLARSGNPASLGTAETAYRSCLERGDPRRATALYGLGNCLLVRGGSGKLDGLTLRAAIDRYTECLREPGVPEALASDARTNQARARLLLMQAPPVAEGAEPEGGESNKDDLPDPRRDGDKPRGGADLAPDRGDHGGGEGKGDGDPREGRPSAGRGGLPPVPERPDAPPLSSADAATHLDIASRAILDEMKAFRRGRARPVGQGAPDW